VKWLIPQVWTPLERRASGRLRPPRCLRKRRALPPAASSAPALVLYLVADAAAAAGQLDPVGAVLALGAASLALAGFGSPRSLDRLDTRRVGQLALASAIALVRAVAPTALTLAVDLAQALATTTAAATLLLQLALKSPDNYAALLRKSPPRLLVPALGVAAAALGALAHAPALVLGGYPLLFEPALAHADRRYH